MTKMSSTPRHGPAIDSTSDLPGDNIAPNDDDTAETMQAAAARTLALQNMGEMSTKTYLPVPLTGVRLARLCLRCLFAYSSRS